MMRNKQPIRSAYREDGLARVVAGHRVILFKIPGVLLTHEGASALLHEGGDISGKVAGMHLCHGVDDPETYLYVVPAAPAPGEAGHGLKDTLAGLQQRVNIAYPGAQGVNLVVTQVISGASAGREARWHYAVETDVLPEAEGDFNDWYAREHLPGLARVPGAVQAMRLQDPTGSPRYHAFYRLESRETFGSEPWLKVRATEWSARVRPNFINTKRTMFRVPTHIV